jgi:hypothetical protein
MFYVDTFKPVKTERTHDNNFKIAFWVSCVVLTVVVGFTSWWFSTLTDKESDIDNYDANALSSTQLGLTFVDGTVNGVLVQYSTRISLINTTSCDNILYEADLANYYEQVYSTYDLYTGNVVNTATFLSADGIISLTNDSYNDINYKCPGINVTTICSTLYSSGGLVNQLDGTSDLNYYVYATNSFTGNQMTIICATTPSNQYYAPQISESVLIDNGFGNMTACMVMFLNDYDLEGMLDVCLNVLTNTPPKFLNVNAKHMDWLDITGLVVAIESFILSILVVLTQICTNKEGAFRGWVDRDILKRPPSSTKHPNEELRQFDHAIGSIENLHEGPRQSSVELGTH